jgi:predicted nucleotidyltransferase
MVWTPERQQISIPARRRTLPVNAHDESSISARVRYAEPEPIRKAVRDYVCDLRAGHPEIRSIRWFGSWVRGDAGVGSDVDLCIIVYKGSVSGRKSRSSAATHSADQY